MIQLLYVSRETQPFEAAQLRALLRQSRDSNAAREITGMLLYRNGFFAQVLEGVPEQVRPLVATIARDPRHKVLVADEQLTRKREFREWSMGFRDLSRETGADLPSLDELSRSPPSRARTMLLGFRDQSALEREEP